MTTDPLAPLPPDDSTQDPAFTAGQREAHKDFTSGESRSATLRYATDAFRRGYNQEWSRLTQISERIMEETPITPNTQPQ